nr:MAG TPA: hypothetical protein [Caudoviricetes sp.]
MIITLSRWIEESIIIFQVNYYLTRRCHVETLHDLF